MKERLGIELHQLHAEVLTGLADPRRLVILYSLASSPKSARDLARDVELGLSSVLRHLLVMHRDGLVLASFVRGETRYEVADDRILEALDLLRGVLRESLYRRAEMAGALAAR